MKLTLQQLIDAKACRQQVDLFRELFGDEVEVTEDACIAVADKFDFDWAAKHFLSAPALAKYERIRASEVAKYERIRASAVAKYERIRASAWAEYWRVIAAAFGRLYSSPTNTRKR